MAKRPPKRFRIAHDDYHAEYVGKTADGSQFFLTTPFVPGDSATGSSGREFIALYVFDNVGALLKAVIDELGSRATMDESARVTRRDELLRGLGRLRFCDITISPFQVEQHGAVFGLVPQPPEEPGDEWCVIIEPGNYMCFWPPWTSGEYDT
jgi:hypothetical protein